MITYFFYSRCSRLTDSFQEVSDDGKPDGCFKGAVHPEILGGRGELQVFQDLHHIVHIEVAEPEAIPCRSSLFDDGTVGNGIRGGCPVGTDETRNPEFNSPEIPHYDNENITEGVGVNYRKNLPACRPGWFPVVICAKSKSLIAKTPGIAMMPGVVILLLQGIYYGFYLLLCLNGIGQGDETAAVVLEQTLCRSRYAPEPVLDFCFYPVHLKIKSSYF